MYIRWQKRTSKAKKKWLHPDAARWSAVVVESVRIDGKPKQKHVAYLGSFDEVALEPDRVCWRDQFWIKITKRLDQLGNVIPPEDRQRIEAAIAEKIPPVTPDQHAECVRGREAWIEGLKAMAPFLRRKHAFKYKRRPRVNPDRM
jgi:hypothetical protein